MTDLKKPFAAKLYRANCPSSTELGEYHLRILPAERMTWIQTHLSECPLCASEVQGLRTYLDDLAPELEPSLSGRIQTWIAQRIPDLGRGGTPVPGFALRGNAGSVQTYEAGAGQLNLDIQPDSIQPEHRTLLGLLTGVNPEGMNVLLLQGAGSVAAVGLDELGSFVLTGVQPGEYTLILRGPEVEIVIETLPVA